jgi:membrane associated rhomboid family serine protease
MVEDQAVRCYRHPDRETGISCTRCDRPICPECMISASVGFQCPECVRGGSPARAASSGASAVGRPRARAGGDPQRAARPRTLAGGPIARDPRLLTKILIGLNVAVWIAVLVGGDRIVSDLAMIGEWPPAPFTPDQGVAEGQWYRMLTAVFLHQQVMHIGVNMLSLWWLGGPLEAVFGRVRYLALFLLSGLGGSALTYLVADPHEASLGASGAIFGLLGATAVVVRRLNYDMRPVIALLVLNLIFSFAWPDIAWQAHVGGLIVGAAVGYGMVHAPRDRQRLVQQGTCALALLAIVVVVCVRTVLLTG